jgi:hypothetical protein
MLAVTFYSIAFTLLAPLAVRRESIDRSLAVLPIILFD